MEISSNMAEISSNLENLAKKKLSSLVRLGGSGFGGGDPPPEQPECIFGGWDPSESLDLAAISLGLVRWFGCFKTALSFELYKN